MATSRLGSPGWSAVTNKTVRPARRPFAPVHGSSLKPERARFALASKTPKRKFLSAGSDVAECRGVCHPADTAARLYVCHGKRDLAHLAIAGGIPIRTGSMFVIGHPQLAPSPQNPSRISSRARETRTRTPPTRAQSTRALQALRAGDASFQSANDQNRKSRLARDRRQRAAVGSKRKLTHPAACPQTRRAVRSRLAEAESAGRGRRNAKLPWRTGDGERLKRDFSHRIVQRRATWRCPMRTLKSPRPQKDSFRVDKTQPECRPAGSGRRGQWVLGRQSQGTRRPE